MEKNYENSVIEILELDTFDFKDLKAIYIWKNVDWYGSDISFESKTWNAEWYSFRHNWENKFSFEHN